MSPDQVFAAGVAAGVVVGVGLCAVVAPEVLAEWWRALTRRTP